MSQPKWEDPEVRAALIGLAHDGVIQVRKARQELIEYLKELHWISLRGSRRWAIREHLRPHLESLLEHKYPGWRDNAAGADTLLATEREARDQARQRLIKANHSQSEELHHKTAAALQGAHSKQGGAVPIQPGQQLTKDEILRFRCSDSAFQLQIGGKWESASELTRRWGEAVIPERGWLKLTAIKGVPPLCVTVENRCYVDLPLVHGCLYVHAPGANIELVAQVLKKLAPARWIHFGDMDQKGFNIGASLARALDRPLFYWEPTLLEDYIDLFAQTVTPDKVPWQPVSIDDSALVRNLKESGRWLEQEALIMDRRLELILQKVVGNKVD